MIMLVREVVPSISQITPQDGVLKSPRAAVTMPGNCDLPFLTFHCLLAKSNSNSASRIAPGTLLTFRIMIAGPLPSYVRKSDRKSITTKYYFWRTSEHGVLCEGRTAGRYTCCFRAS